MDSILCLILHYQQSLLYMQDKFIEFSRLSTAMNCTDVYRNTSVAWEWLLLNSKDEEGVLDTLRIKNANI